MKYVNHAVIWERKTKNGDTYLSFKADRDIKQGENLNFFKNKFKKEDKHPDFRSYNKVDEQPTTQQPVSDVVLDDVPF